MERSCKRSGILGSKISEKIQKLFFNEVTWLWSDAVNCDEAIWKKVINQKPKRLCCKTVIHYFSKGFKYSKGYQPLSISGGLTCGQKGRIYWKHLSKNKLPLMAFKQFASPLMLPY